MSWLNGFAKCKEVSLTSAAALTDYQMPLTIYRSSGTDSGSSVYVGTDCLSTYADIRFTDGDGNTLPYWIESSTSSSALIWIKVNSIDTSGSSVRLYYGNATAVGESNGEKTFPFFDDFLGSSLDAAKWSVTGSPTVSNSIMTIPSIGDAAKIVSTATFGQNYAMRTRCKSAHFGSTSYIENVAFQDQGYLGTLLSYIDAAYAGKHISYSDEFAFESTSATGITANTYFVLDQIRNGSTSVIFKVDGANTVTHTTKVPTTTYGVRFLSQVNGASVSADWVLVRKYASSEPAFSTWSAAESAPAQTNGMIRRNTVLRHQRRSP